MAGAVKAEDEIDLAEARVISQWMARHKTIPSPHQWIQGLIDQRNSDPMAGFI